MLPLLTAPWALAALAALPALAALYWLRNTWRETPVSSLMLWMHQSEAQASGLRMRRLQTPLLFFLEIAALLLLALAAAGPRIDTAQGNWPLVVVLDDSFSMLAGGDASPRRLGHAALEHELRWGDEHPVRFVLAGETPQLLGDNINSWSEALAALENWRCRAPTASLPQATAFAGELSHDKARLLVISDHAPDHDPGVGRLQWWSVGKPRDNVAFVGAARSVRDGLDRCLLEIGNFSPQSQTTMLVVQSADTGRELHRESLTLTANQVHRTILRLPKDIGTVAAHISDDALPFDNQVTLVRDESPTVRVLTQIKNETLRSPMEKALQATGRVAAAGSAPDLVITDESEPTVVADAWIVQVVAEKDAEAFVGPYVLDRTHPLTDGLNLAGVVWGAGPAREQPGNPVILCGAVPLVTDSERLSGQRHIRLRLRPDLSTLIEAPAWPSLIWNLVHWRATELPGVRRANVRLGELAQVVLPQGVESVLHIPPHGPTRIVPVQNRLVALRPDEPGVHLVEAGTMKYRFAVNVLRPEESDLTKCATGRWGEWSEDSATAPALVQLAWIPLLIVLGILTLHMALVMRAGK